MHKKEEERRIIGPVGNDSALEESLKERRLPRRALKKPNPLEIASIVENLRDQGRAATAGPISIPAIKTTPTLRIPKIIAITMEKKVAVSKDL